LADLVALGHFLVNDSSARRHPLDVAWTDRAAVAQTVAVLDRTGQNVSNGLDAAVRVPGKAGEVILRNIVAEVVEEKERVELGGVAEAERTAQVHARAFKGRFGPNEPFNWSERHVVLSCSRVANLNLEAGVVQNISSCPAARV